MRALPRQNTKILAIDFHRDRMAIVYLKGSPAGFQLLAYDTREIPPGEDALDDKRVEFIRHFLKKKSARPGQVVLSVSDADAVAASYLVLPSLPQDEIISAAKWQLKEEIDFDLEKAAAGWQIVKEYADDEEARKVGIVCVAIEKSRADRYLSFLAPNKLAPAALTTNFVNYACLLECLPDLPPVVAVLDIGLRDARVSLYLHHKLVFARPLPFSISRLIQSLTGSLVTEKGKIALSLEEAEEIFEQQGIPEEEGQVIRQDILGSHLISFMRPFLEGLVRELRFSFDYLSSIIEADAPQVFYLAGEGADIKNLDKYLSKEFGAQVSALPLPSCVGTAKIKGGLAPRDQHRIASAVGAALYDAADMNLLPDEIRSRQGEMLRQVSLRMIIFSLSLAFVFLTLVVEFRIHDFSQRLDLAQKHLQTIQSALVVKQKDVLVEKIQQAEVVVDGVLKALSQVIPDDILVTELVFSRADYTLVLKGNVRLDKHEPTPAPVRFIEQLKRSPFFEGVTLSWLKINEGSQDFEMTCTLSH